MRTWIFANSTSLLCWTLVALTTQVLCAESPYAEFGRSYFWEDAPQSSSVSYVGYDESPQGQQFYMPSDFQPAILAPIPLPEPGVDLDPPANEPAPPETVDDPPSESPPETNSESKTEEETIAESEYGYFEYIPYGRFIHADYYFGHATWTKSIELGLNGQTGNSESNSLRVGAKVKRNGVHTVFNAEFKHLRTSNEEEITQNNAFFKQKLDWPLTIHERWSVFEKTDLEYDEFKAFDLRLVFNSGVSYKPYKTDRTDWTISSGAGFSREYGGPDNTYVPEGSIGTSLTHDITKRQAIELEFDFYPALDGEGSYRHVTDCSYRISIDHGLSLKLSAVNRYDSTPNGRRPNDLDYAALLLWQF